MAQNSTIEWTQSTWNPITGCTKVSEGCRHCYAERMARRLQAMGHPSYVNGFRVTVHPRLLRLPLEWKKGQMVFVNSMGDLFHEDIPASVIQAVFGVMNQAHWHRFQVLTKRADRLLKLAPTLAWGPNVWMGVTVEASRHLDRIKRLRQVPAAVRFVSFEPLLSMMDRLNLADVHWVIVGGESGPGARPVDPAWVRRLRDYCVLKGLPFFFKQWGGVHRKRAGRVLDGMTWSQMPQ